jgi:mono/diheme cytochrome c family protein
MSKAKCFSIFLAIIGVMAAALAAFFWFGSYDVAANVPHWGITLRILEDVKDRSIAARSKGIAIPFLKESSVEERGLHHFHPMCRLCHGAPGSPRNEFAQGLYPSPPDLASGQVQRKRNDAELYWIIKNGLKMTGMPAFGATHAEDDLWGMVAFLRRLPGLSADDYLSRVTAAKHRDDGEEPDHHDDHQDRRDHHGNSR